MAAPEFGRAAGVLWLLPVLFWNGIVGGFDTVLALQYLRERRARLEWVEVDATVLSSEVVSNRSSDGTTSRALEGHADTRTRGSTASTK